MQNVTELTTRHLYITVRSDVSPSFRVAEIQGRFDFQQDNVEESFSVELPVLDGDWTIGAIIGPSGSGKSTVAKQYLGNRMVGAFDWDRDKAVIDCFPERFGGMEVAEVFSAVGFSSTPSWLKPFHVLSNGEKFRCELARSLLSDTDIVVFDEFTSVVDRTVAKAASHAVQKFVRKNGNKKFVAVSCHYDILDWLRPDWELDMASQQLARGCLRQRPAIRLRVARCHHSAWRLFRRHHYLSHELNRSAICFAAFWEQEPVGFFSFCSNLGHGSLLAHRLVVLPDYQGLGLGSRLIDLCCSILAGGIGKDVGVKTSHPGLIRSMKSSRNWMLVEHERPYSSEARITNTVMLRKRKSLSSLRFSGSFRYIGPTMPEAEAVAVLDGTQIPLDFIPACSAVDSLLAEFSGTNLTWKGIAKRANLSKRDTIHALNVLKKHGKVTETKIGTERSYVK